MPTSELWIPICQRQNSGELPNMQMESYVGFRARSRSISCAPRSRSSSFARSSPSSSFSIAPGSPRQSEINVRFKIGDTCGGKAKRSDHIQNQEFITDVVVGAGESTENTLRVKVGGQFRSPSRSRDPWIRFYDNLTTRAKSGDWYITKSVAILPELVPGKEEDYVEIPVSIAYTNSEDHSVQTDFLRDTELTSVLRVLRTESHIDVRIYIDATVMEV